MVGQLNNLHGSIEHVTTIIEMLFEDIDLDRIASMIYKMYFEISNNTFRAALTDRFLDQSA